MLSSSSPARKSMPRTPPVSRPIGRSWLSSARKRTDWPLRLTSSRSSSALHSAAPISSSPSFRWMAIRPPDRLESKRVSSVFLVLPDRVARTR